MRKLLSVTMMGVVVMGFGMGLSGCSDDTTTKKDTPATTGGAAKAPDTKAETPGAPAKP